MRWGTLTLWCVFTGCGYPPEAMQVKQDRIDNLQRAVNELEALHRQLLAKFKQVTDENIELSERLIACGGTVPPASWVGNADAPGGSTSGAAASAPKSDPANPHGAVFKVDGTGLMTTRPFTVSGPWEVRWAAAGQGNMRFFVTLYNAQGGLLGVILSHEGDGSGRTYQPRPGTYYLEVHAEAEWGIEIHHVK